MNSLTDSTRKNARRHSVALVLLMMAAILAAQGRAQEQKPSGDPKAASVGGRVTVHGKGQSRIWVELTRLQPKTPSFELHSTTADDGSFRFSDVPPATYRVQWSNSNFYSSGDLESTKTVTLGAGEHVHGVDFEILPVGIITGRVVDMQGNPAARQSVQLFQSKPSASGAGELMPTGGYSETNTAGVYRIPGVRAGRYLVGSHGWRTNGQTTFPSKCSETFYPGVTDSSKAGAVEVSEGAQLVNVDIIVGGPSQCFSASGQIVYGDTGLPIAKARFSVFRVQDERIGNRADHFSVANGKGEFRISGLAPGRYKIVIEGIHRTSQIVDSAQFDIADKDIGNLNVRYLDGASVSGLVVIEGAQDEATRQKLSQLLLGANINNGGPPTLASFEPGPIGLDGTFHLRGLPAGIASFGLVDRKDFLVLRNERDGIEQAKGIPIKGNEYVAGVKVVVAYGTGSIRGAVKYLNGLPPPNWYVQVGLYLPGGKRELTRSRPDERGNFLVQGLPAGRYRLELTAFIPELDKTVSTSQEVTVANDAVSKVAMNLNLRSSPSAKPRP